MYVCIRYVFVFDGVLLHTDRTVINTHRVNDVLNRDNIHATLPIQIILPSSAIFSIH